MNLEEDGVRYLTLEEIEAAPDVQEEDVDVPEWGGTVRVRGFTKDVEMACREEARDEDGDVDRGKLEMLFLVHGIINPPVTATSVTMLAKKSSSACNRVLRTLMRLNGQDDESNKRREKDFREGPSPAVPLSVVSRSGDDGGESASTDVDEGVR